MSFDLKTVQLDGGISYPNFIAFKVGPHVLAIDQSLNPLVKNLDAVTTAKTGGINISKKLLPNGWVGSQIFKVNSTYNGKPVDLILVPFCYCWTDGR
ncbi:hypothetical protein [Ferruginibacter sp.]|uniref:hypothetical protein n=1 Tax=Ferruginibacter sp. TaxID=1940288 RepID=UPI0019B4C62C|nr:hypothetical protein [Ferruginibacter sp.]MBC7627117.1 hypothetical protein [Ferruginibacter sp.]